MKNKKWVPLRDGAEATSYYKFLQEVTPLSEKKLEEIKTCKGDMEESLPFSQRAKMQEAGTCLPAKTGYYPLKEGGMLVASNVPIPDITPEMLIWWSSIYPMDSLLYAIWDPEDHYDAQADFVAKQRFLDNSIPPIQKLWGATHTGTEDLGTGPAPGIIHFRDPGEMGFDRELIGTEQCPYLYCGNTVFAIGPVKIPIFLMETYCYGENNISEVRFRAWIGYSYENGIEKCHLPKFMKIPGMIPKGLIHHNFKEFGHLNRVLPVIYKEKEQITEEIIKKLHDA